MTRLEVAHATVSRGLLVIINSPNDFCVCYNFWMIDFSAQTGSTRTLRLFLLFLIVIGIILLILRNTWVPPLVSYLIGDDYQSTNEQNVVKDESSLNDLYPEIVTEGYKVDYIYTTGEQPLKENLVFVSPAGEKMIVPDPIWLQISPATAVDKMPNASTQAISGVVANPRTAREVVVSTYEQIPENSGMWRSLYSYNFDTYGLTQLYTDASSKGEALSIVGTDGSKVILASQLFERGGVCSNVWSGDSELFYLDLENVSEGIMPYIPPQELIEAGKKEAEDCAK
jgi:hypothetical protein